MAEKIHDKGYKRILSKKKHFLSLLKDYISESWVTQINEDDLLLVNKEFILKDFKSKEADIIYRVKLNDADKTEVLFYCLIELQSGVDYTMPFRLLIYIVELLKKVFLDTEEKIRERKGYRLPAVVPIVLYNGAETWTAVRNFKEYFTGNLYFSDKLLDFNYLLLSVNQYTDDELLKFGNLLSSVFLLDKKQDVDRLIKNLSVVKHIFNKLSVDDQIDLFEWIRDVLFKKAKNRNEITDVIDEFMKGGENTMTYAIERLFDEIEEKAKNEGKIEGRIEGEIKGKIKIVTEFIKKYNIPLSEAMETAQLPSKYKRRVITQLKKQNITYMN